MFPIYGFGIDRNFDEYSDFTQLVVVAWGNDKPVKCSLIQIKLIVFDF